MGGGSGFSKTFAPDIIKLNNYLDKLLIGLNRAEVGKICLIIFSELPMQNQPDECKPCFL